MVESAHQHDLATVGLPSNEEVIDPDGSRANRPGERVDDGRKMGRTWGHNLG